MADIDIEETWKNYKSLLTAVTSKEPNAVQNLLDQIRSPTEDAKNSEKLTKLLELILELQNLDVLSVLLQLGVRAKSFTDSPKHGILQQAVVSGKIPFISDLLSNGVNWRVTDKNGNTPLHLAFTNKSEGWKAAKMHSKNLLKHQADSLIVEILKSLLSVPLDVNSVNKDGDSPLALAVKDRLRGATEFLINKGATLIILGDTVSHYLIKDELKLASKPEDYGPWMRQTNIDFMDWWFSLKLDVHRKNSRGETPLQACTKLELKPVFTILLKYIDDVNVEDDSKQTPLHTLLDSVKSLTKSHEIAKAANFVKKLIDEGMFVDKQDKYGNTPFHVAASLKTPVMMELMLEKFTNANASNDFNETALHAVIKNCSMQHRESYAKIVGELIAKGADVNRQNNSGDTPLHLACAQDSLLHQDIANLLIEKGCDINLTNIRGSTPLFSAIDSNCPVIAGLLIDNGTDVHFREKSTNYTALHKASKKFHTALTAKLIKAKVDVNARDSKGMTPLHLLAALPGHTVGLDLAIAQMGVLLNSHADVNARDNKNWTPLRTALDTFEYPSVGVFCLLQFGANVYPEDYMVMKIARCHFNDKAKICVIIHLLARKIAGFDIKPFDEIVNGEKSMTEEIKQKYRAEVATMKSTLIGDNVSVYDVLHMEYKSRLNYMRQEKFKELRAESYAALRKQFPMFNLLITARYWTAVTRDRLVTKAKKAWAKLVDVRLSDSLVERIFSYLDDSVLRVMISGEQ